MMIRLVPCGVRESRQPVRSREKEREKDRDNKHKQDKEGRNE
jgi:hypothetical protein